MHVSRKTAISTASIAAIVIAVLVVIVAGAYIATQPSSTVTVTKSTTATSTSGYTTISTTTYSSASPTYTPASLQAGGSTFVNPVMQVWVSGFAYQTGGAVKIDYSALGSTAGQKGILKKTYAFGASDAPISSLLYTQNYTAAYGPLLTIPEALGGVAIFYNIPKLTVSLNLTGPIIADIYLRNITSWNDSAILAINPGVNKTLLNIPIIPVHRSDGSGTTYALTTFLERTSTDWNASGLGRGTLVNWPSTGELGASGSGGVAGDVASNAGAIGYADSYYALSNKLLAADIENSAGKFVAPTLSTITEAATADSALVQADPTYSITDAPTPSNSTVESYPISTYTYILVWADQTNQGQGYDIAQFLMWVVTYGQADSPPLNYAALPANIVAIDQGLIGQLNYNGVPFISG